MRNAGHKVTFHFAQLPLAIKRAPGRQLPDQRRGSRCSDEGAKPKPADALELKQRPRAGQIDFHLQEVRSRLGSAGARQYGRGWLTVRAHRRIMCLRFRRAFSTLQNVVPDPQILLQAAKPPSAHFDANAKVPRHLPRAMNNLGYRSADFPLRPANEPPARRIAAGGDGKRQPILVLSLKRAWNGAHAGAGRRKQTPCALMVRPPPPPIPNGISSSRLHRAPQTRAPTPRRP